MITGFVRSAKRNASITRGSDQLTTGRYCFDVLDCLCKRDRDHVSCLQSNHHTAFAVCQCSNCTRAKIGCEHTVECIRAAAPLEMSEHYAASFPAGKCFQILLQVLANATEPGCAMSITLVLINQVVPDLQSALRNNDNTKIRSGDVARVDLLSHGFQREGNLRNQDYFG